MEIRRKKEVEEEKRRDNGEGDKQRSGYRKRKRKRGTESFGRDNGTDMKKYRRKCREKEIWRHSKTRKYT